MKKILIVATVGVFYEFLFEQIRHFIDLGYDVHCAGNFVGDHVNKNELISLGAVVHQIDFSRSVTISSYRKSYFEMRSLLSRIQFDIVHCHTPNAAVVARLVCRRFRKQGLKVIYTAHGFHFYQGAPIKNWLYYYPIEWICSFWTDILITINKEDYLFAQKHMHANHIDYIPGVGINVENFCIQGIDRAAKRAELGIPQDATILLSVGELNENKNHRTVIQAIAGMDVYYIIAGEGDQEEALMAAAAKAGMKDRVKLLGQRSDIAELLAAVDIFVFPSFREGLSVSLMEAMASGRPVAISRIRGNMDLYEKNGGALFDPHSAKECREAIQKVMNSDWTTMSGCNAKKASNFSAEAVLQRLEEIYGDDE